MEPAVSSSSSEAGHNEDDDLESVSEAESNPNEDAKSYQSVEEQGEEYETADSGVSEQSSVTGCENDQINRKRKRKLSLLSGTSSDHPIAGTATDQRRRQTSLNGAESPDCLFIHI